MQRWEYLTSKAPDLERLGADGWELVAVAEGTFYFKRPAPSVQERITLEQRKEVYATRGMKR